MGFPRQEYWSGYHFLLQGIFLMEGSNLGLLHCRQILYWLSHREAQGKWNEVQRHQVTPIFTNEMKIQYWVDQNWNNHIFFLCTFMVFCFGFSFCLLLFWQCAGLLFRNINYERFKIYRDLQMQYTHDLAYQRQRCGYKVPVYAS